MKVGTDSILLGAWTSIPASGRILDIGSGTGILALMMAQKDKEAFIDAVEVDESAAYQCQENIANSSWANRITVFFTAIQDFGVTHTYDLIITNPPYFSTDLAALKLPRSLARQGKDLDTASLIFQVDRLLKKTGTCTMVLPYASLKEVEEILEPYQLFLQKICRVRMTPLKPPSRILLLLGRERKTLKEEEIVIQTGGANEYSQAYRDLTRDFYLHLD